MSVIFISYRRTDSGGYAGRIFDRLREEFGKDQVFRDVDTIDGGTRFRDEIAKQLDTCKVVLVVIGPTWLDSPDELGRCRLDDAEDWVRIEVSTALRHNVCVIPVTVGGAPLPAAKDLPEDLRGLVQFQRRDLRDGDTWNSDLQLLVRRVASELGTHGSRVRRTVYASIVALAAVMVVAGLYVLRPGRGVPIRPVTMQSEQSATKVETAPITTLQIQDHDRVTAGQTPVAVAGKWSTLQLTNPYAENEKFTLVFEFEMLGDKLLGTVIDSGHQFAILGGKANGDVVSFYTQSEAILGDETKPFKEFYDGIVKGDRIEFRRQDDLSSGGIPMKFVATRQP